LRRSYLKENFNRRTDGRRTNCEKILKSKSISKESWHCWPVHIFICVCSILKNWHLLLPWLALTMAI